MSRNKPQQEAPKYSHYIFVTYICYSIQFVDTIYVTLNAATGNKYEKADSYAMEILFFFEKNIITEQIIIDLTSRGKAPDR